MPVEELLHVRSFWIINVSYQMIWRFPVVIIRWVLLASAISVTFL